MVPFVRVIKTLRSGAPPPSVPAPMQVAAVPIVRRGAADAIDAKYWENIKKKNQSYITYKMDYFLGRSINLQFNHEF